MWAVALGYWWYSKKVVQPTQYELAQVWKMIPEQEISHGQIISWQDTLYVDTQEQPNSCHKRVVATILSRITKQTYNEQDVQELFAKYYPLTTKMRDEWIDGNNPMIWGIVDVLNIVISSQHYTAEQQSSFIVALDFASIIDMGGMMMIPIHSRLWFPHRVLAYEYDLDPQWKMIVKIFNPSALATDLAGNRIHYRDASISLDQIQLWNQALINEVSFANLQFLNQRAMIWYYGIELFAPDMIAIYPQKSTIAKNESVDSSLR